MGIAPQDASHPSRFGGERVGGFARDGLVGAGLVGDGLLAIGVAEKVAVGVVAQVGLEVGGDLLEESGGAGAAPAGVSGSQRGADPLELAVVAALLVPQPLDQSAQGGRARAAGWPVRDG
jgi:hypothetical protein